MKKKNLFPVSHIRHDEEDDDRGPCIIAAKDLPKSEYGAFLSTSTSFVQTGGGNDWVPSTKADKVRMSASPRYPVFDEKQLRKQCQDSIQEKTPKILVERLKQERFLPWSELSLLEKRLVDCNPWFFEVSIDLPDFAERRVTMINSSKIDQMDVTCKKGGLREAVDEDFAWLPDAYIVHPLHKFSICECAVMAFTPPRCFIMCVKDGTDEERFNDISDILRDWYTRSPPKERDTEVRPGGALVGVRSDVFMRVVVLEADVRKPTKVRCVCMDYNAIYSFERENLYPLPPEFSPQKLPVNIFLGRFRGTHYVFKDKYVEVNNAMCQPNKDEGIVSFVTCAIYGAAPDGLTVVDAAMPDDNGWVSSLMIRARIAAPMAGDPNIRCSAAQAEAAVQKMYSKEKDQVSSGKETATEPENGNSSFESVVYSPKSDCDSADNRILKTDDDSEKEHWQSRSSTSSKSSFSERSASGSEVESSEEAMRWMNKKREEECSMFKELAGRTTLNTAANSNTKGINKVEKESCDINHLEDDVKLEHDPILDVFGNEQKLTMKIEDSPQWSVASQGSLKSRIHGFTDEDKNKPNDLPAKKIENVMEKELGHLTASQVENIEKAAMLGLEQLKFTENSETAAVPQADNKKICNSSDATSSTPRRSSIYIPHTGFVNSSENEVALTPSSMAAPNLVPTDEVGDNRVDVEVEELHNAFEAYISARRLARNFRCAEHFVAAMDFSVISALNSAGRLLIGKDTVSANADQQTVIADLNAASELAFSVFMEKGYKCWL